MYSLERKFILTANDQMQVLEEIWGAGSLGNTDNPALQNEQERTVTALHSIKFAANSVQAKGVYRAANYCETIHTNFNGENRPKLRGGLAGLKNLIFQYADGLFEIDPEFKAQIQSRKTNPETALENVSKEQGRDNNLETKCLQEKNTQAALVLKPLLSLVKNGDRRQALESLMTFDTQDQEERSMIPVNAPPKIAVKFENLMGPITSLVLSEARHSGKQVSVSYATDFDELGLSMANRVQEFLEILCLHIVTDGVAGNQNTQISLTGQVKENTYIFNINWRGNELDESSQKETRFKRGLSKLRHDGGDMAFRNLALEQIGHTPVMQTLQITFPRILAKTHAANSIFTLKPEDEINITQGATG